MNPHITVSSKIISIIVADYFEEKLGQKIDATEWIADDQFGFAGLRLMFENNNESREES